MNEIFSIEDLRAYAAQNGPYVRLSGNIVPNGITVDLTTVPEDMIGMRGVVRMEHTTEALAQHLDRGEIQDGEAVFLLAQAGCTGEQVSLLENAIRRSGCRHLALILGGKPERPIQGAVNFWVPSLEEAEHSHASVLKDGDRVEYDLTVSLFGADLIECLDHRLGPRAGEPFYYRQLAPDLWIIGEEFTRMFLILGRERGLLVDAGFGYGDLAAAVRRVTSLPVEVALTHGHFDHAGGIGFFNTETIYLHKADFPFVEARQGSEILKRLTPLEDGHVFDLGGRRVRAIWLPGHSAGSMVFWEEDSGLLFAGDSLLCGPFFLLNGEADIRSLLSGLNRLLQPELGIQTFYPAHRELFPMTRDDVQQAVAFLEDVLHGRVRGVPTWIAPMETSPYKTYRSGAFSLYSL